MKQILTLGRRQFLRGASNFTLALPFLPSLMPKAMGKISQYFKNAYVKGIMENADDNLPFLT